MKKLLFTLLIVLNILQANTLNKAQKMCENNQAKEAIKIYTSLSDNGNDKATIELIKIYNWGKCGIKHNYTKAHFYLEILANKGNIEAADSLADNYMIGTGVTKNLEKAEYWLTKYRDISNAKDQYNIATKFSILGIHDKALKWYLMSAKQNYVESFYWLGKIYLLGSGSTLKDPKKALYWWEKGANLGDFACMEKTSDLYHRFGNEKKYVFWLEKAANKKSSYRTQYYLGLYYFDDESKYTDKKKASYWIEKAHKNGSEDAKIFWDKYELWKYK